MKKVKRIIMLGMGFSILNLISGLMVITDNPQNTITTVSVICNVIAIVTLVILLCKTKDE